MLLILCRNHKFDVLCFLPLLLLTDINKPIEWNMEVPQSGIKLCCSNHSIRLDSQKNIKEIVLQVNDILGTRKMMGKVTLKVYLHLQKISTLCPCSVSCNLFVLLSYQSLNKLWYLQLQLWLNFDELNLYLFSILKGPINFSIILTLFEY